MRPSIYIAYIYSIYICIHKHTHTCTYTNTHLILSDDRLVFKLKSVLLSIRWVLQVYKRYKRYILLFSYYIGNYIWLSILIAYIDWCVWETERVRARAEACFFCVYSIMSTIWECIRVEEFVSFCLCACGCACKLRTASILYFGQHFVTSMLL